MSGYCDIFNCNFPSILYMLFMLLNNLIIYVLFHYYAWFMHLFSIKIFFLSIIINWMYFYFQIGYLFIILNTVFKTNILHFLIKFKALIYSSIKPVQWLKMSPYRSLLLRTQNKKRDNHSWMFIHLRHHKNWNSLFHMIMIT